jgi:hypothetical protein
MIERNVSTGATVAFGERLSGALLTGGAEKFAFVRKGAEDRL